MDKRILVPVLFLLLVITGMPKAQSLTYNTTVGNLVYEDTVYTDPYSPRISCNSDNTKCLLLIYDDNVLANRGVKVLYSTNKFSGCAWGSADPSTCVTITTISTTYNVSFYTHYPMPFDAFWSETDSAFFVVDHTKVYKYTPLSNTWTTNRTINGSEWNYGAATSCSVGATKVCDGAPQILGLINSTDMLVFCGHADAQGVGTDCGFYSISAMKIFSTAKTDIVSSTEDGTCLDGVAFCAGAPTWYARGFTTYESGVKAETFLASTSNCVGGHGITASGCAYSYDSLTYGGAYDGLNHYMGDYLYYPDDSATDGIYNVYTTDLSTFGTPALVYATDSSIAEEINMSDSEGSSARILGVWERYSNSTGDGIYLEEQANFPVTVTSPYTMLVTGESGGSVGSFYGTEGTFYAPGDTLSLTIQSAHIPLTYNTTVDFTGCESATIHAYHENAPYTYTIKVLDSLTYQPISGVNVTLDGTSSTSNANGFATFTITPVNGATFDQEGTGCELYFYLDGTAKSYNLKAALTNYNNYTTTLTPATKKTSYTGNTTAWDFVTNQTIYMDPTGVIINAHVITEDNVEIYPKTYMAYVTGNNNETWTTKGSFKVPRNYNNWASGPVKFLLYDNRSSYNVTVTLDPPSGANVTHTLTVTRGNTYDVDLQIPYSLIEIPCSEAEDCSPSFCDAEGFYNSLTGCSGYCRYKQYDCVTPELCDERVGCFDVDTTTNCSVDLDCNNTCTGTYAMFLGRCGSDGYCKNIYKECKEECNATVGICQESVDCILGDTLQVGWEIPYHYADSSGDYGTATKGHLTEQTCNLQNAGTRKCYHGDVVDTSTLTAYGGAGAIVTYPTGYPATASGTNLTFKDFVISCSDSCGATLEICDYGCSDVSNQCVNKPTGPSGALTGLVSSLGLGWLSSIWWYILSLIVAVGALLLVIRESGMDGSVGWELSGVVFIIMMVIGLTIPQISGVNMIFGVLLCILVGLGLAAKLSRQ